MYCFGVQIGLIYLRRALCDETKVVLEQFFHFMGNFTIGLVLGGVLGGYPPILAKYWVDWKNVNACPTLLKVSSRSDHV